MKCVRTGIIFSVTPQTGVSYHGDMYYYQDLNCLVIRGIASQTSRMIPCIIVTQNNDSYSITEIDNRFCEWWKDWNSEIDMNLPIIIADSRF